MVAENAVWHDNHVRWPIIFVEQCSRVGRAISHSRRLSQMVRDSLRGGDPTCIGYVETSRVPKGSRARADSLANRALPRGLHRKSAHSGANGRPHDVGKKAVSGIILQ